MATLNVRTRKKLADSTTEALTSLSKKRTVILCSRKQTSLDTDSVNDKLRSTIMNYIKENNKGKAFTINIKVNDKNTTYELVLNATTSLTKISNVNLFAVKSDVIVSTVNENIDYLVNLRTNIDNLEEFTHEFIIDEDNEELTPRVSISINTRTKYF